MFEIVSMLLLIGGLVFTIRFAWFAGRFLALKLFSK